MLATLYHFYIRMHVHVCASMHVPSMSSIFIIFTKIHFYKVIIYTKSSVQLYTLKDWITQVNNTLLKKKRLPCFGLERSILGFVDFVC